MNRPQKAIRSIRILTGIRFYAALHVVLFHTLDLFGDSASLLPRFVTNFISKGESAVAFFFILSGFILTHVYKNKLHTKEEKKKYFIARIARLYPLYFLAFLIDLPRGLQYFFDQYSTQEAVVKSLISSFAHITMIQSWIPRLTPIWNSPAWSLSTEMFFYISFIALLPRIVTIKSRAIHLLSLYTIPIILFFIFTTFFPSFVETSSFRILWRSFPPLRLIEFLIGIHLYFFAISHSKIVNSIKDNKTPLLWGSLFISILSTSMPLPFSEKLYTSIILVPLFSLIILCSFWDNVKGDYFFKSTPLFVLGSSSYALYIIHRPYEYYLRLFTSPSLATGLVYIASTTGLSIVLYKFFEGPLQGKVLKFYKRIN